jgi:hypothetical protein
MKTNMLLLFVMLMTPFIGIGGCVYEDTYSDIDVYVDNAYASIVDDDDDDNNVKCS